jgi:hypothetical protein
MTTSQSRHSNIKASLRLFLQKALPILLGGMAVAFGGFYLIWRFMDGHEYTLTALLAWLIVFWVVFPPIFHKVVPRMREDGKRTPVRR